MWALTNVMAAGFARAIQGISSNNGWDHLYQISYFYGFCVSLTLHALLHAVFPAARQRGSSPFVLEEHADMIHVVDSDGGTVASAGDIENIVAVPKM